MPDNGGVYFVPAFSGLYAPYWYVLYCTIIMFIVLLIEINFNCEYFLLFSSLYCSKESVAMLFNVSQLHLLSIFSIILIHFLLDSFLTFIQGTIGLIVTYLQLINILPISTLF